MCQTLKSFLFIHGDTMALIVSIALLFYPVFFSRIHLEWRGLWRINFYRQGRAQSVRNLLYWASKTNNSLWVNNMRCSLCLETWEYMSPVSAKLSHTGMKGPPCWYLSPVTSHHTSTFKGCQSECKWKLMKYKI